MSARSRYLPTALILGLGLSTTLAFTFWVARWERLSRQSEFQKQINNLTTALQRTTNRYNELLLSMGDLYTANDHDVTEPAFSRFVQRAIETYPGIQALEWAPLLSQRDRTTYEQWLQAKTGRPGLGITERNEVGELVPALERPSYVPVTFLEPWSTNEAALGYDLASDETRRIALQRARDTGEKAATGRIQLVQDRAENQYSFLVFLPVYRQPAHSVIRRRQLLLGYLLGVFRVADVVEEALSDLDNEIDFYILDQTARGNEQRLGFYDAKKKQLVSDWGKTVQFPKEDATGFPFGDAMQSRLHPTSLCPTGLHCTATISLGQREWQLLFLPPRHPSPPWAALATALIGLLITTILLVYLARWQSELQRSRELSDLKLSLFSMASHELRTPLSVISVSAQSLATNRNSLSPQQQTTAIERMQLAARRMGQLIEDILMLTRAEAGKLEVNPEILELGLFCSQVCDQIQLLPGQTLRLEGNDIEAKVYFDKKLLQSVLTNLLSNAAKYSPPNYPIRLVVTATDDNWIFQVIDQGIGIPTAAQGKVFEAFYRGANVGQVQGTGLGLAVAKTCTELMEGHLTVQSEPPNGTCITATLPRVH